MKNFVILICLLVVPMCCYSQLFSYDYDKESVHVEPAFENNPVKGKRDGLLEFDSNEFRKKNKFSRFKVFVKRSNELSFPKDRFYSLFLYIASR